MTANGIANHPVAEPATSSTLNNLLNPRAEIIKKVTLRPSSNLLKNDYTGSYYRKWEKNHECEISFDVGAINIFPNNIFIITLASTN